MRAYLNLRYTNDLRARIFKTGLESLGYQVLHGIPGKFDAGDLFVTWNRISFADHAARNCTAAGGKVLVVENASWGNEFAGDTWYHMARDYHNQSGRFPIGSLERWDSLGVTPAPWRTEGETVVLLQRGIGVLGCPSGWDNFLIGRRRSHPGRNKCKPLEQDLANAGKVITWGSGAAVKALLWGIPVESKMPQWIGEQDNTDAGRLAMFQRLAWAQWRLSEIESGFAFRWLL